jgi:predicted adenylyl cyclase CyaB
MYQELWMPINIEIKARVHDFDRLYAKAEQLSDQPCQVIPQEDTFFNCPLGRLKLRELSPRHGQLVYYQRADISGPKHSDYEIVETDNPAGLREILSKAMGMRGVVSKVRYLFMVGQTRIHLDRVAGLGDFMELEVVLTPGQNDADGERIAKNLMQQLGIREQDLIDTAYMDLIEK